VIKGISFQASLYKFSTLVDGGARLTLDIPQSEVDQAMEAAKLVGRNLMIGIVENKKANLISDESASQGVK
jgi:hypothetical protein